MTKYRIRSRAHDFAVQKCLLNFIDPNTDLRFKWHTLFTTRSKKLAMLWFLRSFRG